MVQYTTNIIQSELSYQICLVSTQLIHQQMHHVTGIIVQWEPCISVCAACDCDRVGSATLQCDRHTGACECLEGVGGHKCDRCARGTTGFMPNCVPCGECFDDWDRIISELSSKFTFKRIF